MLIQPVFTPVGEKFIIYSDEYCHLHTVLIVRMLFLILNQKCFFDTFTFWCLLYDLAPLMEISPLNSEFRVLNWIHSGLSGMTPTAPHHSEAILVHQVWSLEFIMPGVDWWIQSRERPLLTEVFNRGLKQGHYTLLGGTSITMLQLPRCVSTNISFV